MVELRLIQFVLLFKNWYIWKPCKLTFISIKKSWIFAKIGNTKMNTGKPKLLQLKDKGSFAKHLHLSKTCLTGKVQKLGRQPRAACQFQVVTENGY